MGLRQVASTDAGQGRPAWLLGRYVGYREDNEHDEREEDPPKCKGAIAP